MKLILVLVLSATAYGTSLNIYRPVEVAEGTYVLSPTVPGEAQVGVVIGERSVAVIGAPKSGVYSRQILGHVAALTDKPVSHVIVLSGLCDHACGSQEFAASATIVASAQLDPATAGREWANWIPDGPEYLVGAGIAKPDVRVTTTARVDLGGRTIVVRNFGPATDAANLVAYQEDVRLAWVGPMLMEVPRAAQRTAGSLRRSATAQAVANALPSYRVVPGHGSGRALPSDALHAAR